MGDEPISLYSETIALVSYNSDGDNVTVERTFVDGANLPHIALMLKRLLVASGFEVTEVVNKSSVNESSSEDAYV